MFPYIGGKNAHISWLDPLFTKDFDTYCEVFGGAGWLSVKSKSILVADNRIYNDFNPFIANIYECFRTKPAELLVAMESYPKSDGARYRQFQQEIFGDNPTVVLGDVELAAKYLYLQTQIFSGMTLSLNSSYYFVDVSSNNKYSSKYDTLKKKLRTPKILERLSQISTVENLDCIEVIKKYDSENTFFYVDPPYYKKEFLYTTDFPRAKHEELSDTLKSAKGKWLLSYYDFSELEQWYPKDKYHWHSQDVFRYSSTRACQSADYKTTSRGTEIAIMNYTPMFDFGQ